MTQTYYAFDEADRYRPHSGMDTMQQQYDPLSYSQADRHALRACPVARSGHNHTPPLQETDHVNGQPRRRIAVAVSTSAIWRLWSLTNRSGIEISTLSTSLLTFAFM